jgi:hypothetical protein
MSMSEDEKIEKIKINLASDTPHEQIKPEILCDILDESGDNWRWQVWHPIPASQVFDSLYAGSGRYAAFLYFEVLFEYDKEEEEWTYDDSTDFIHEWLVDHPPFPELESIAALYEYSRGLSTVASPWLLLQYITGIAVTSQGMGLNSLMGIGPEDAKLLGPALSAWGEFHDVAHAYIELIMMYGEDEV